MWPPDLPTAQRPAYIRALHSQTAQVTTFTMLDLAHNVSRDLHPVALDGQVDINNDSEADVLRTMQAGFYDPDHVLHAGTDMPSDGSVAINMLVRATVSHYVDALGRWVSTPVFTGRPSVIGHEGGARWVLQAQDKACLYLVNCAGGKINKGTRVIQAITNVLRALGERFFRFPPVTSISNRVAKDIRFGGGDEDKQPWKVLRKIAHDAGLQLYFDPEGYACLRKYPTGSPQITWDASTMTAQVQTDIDLTAIKNRVIATGHKARTVANLAATHPFSPRSLANGPAAVPWVNAHYASSPHLRGLKLAQFATRELDRVVTQGVSVRMSVVPVFHLEPLDRCAVILAEGSELFALQDASIPLGADSDMSIGSQKRVRNPKAGRIGVAS